jgi:hypothetical protein
MTDHHRIRPCSKRTEHRIVMRRRLGSQRPLLPRPALGCCISCGGRLVRISPRYSWSASRGLHIPVHLSAVPACSGRPRPPPLPRVMHAVAACIKAIPARCSLVATRGERRSGSGSISRWPRPASRPGAESGCGWLYGTRTGVRSPVTAATLVTVRSGPAWSPRLFLAATRPVQPQSAQVPAARDTGPGRGRLARKQAAIDPSSQRKHRSELGRRPDLPPTVRVGSGWPGAGRSSDRRGRSCQAGEDSPVGVGILTGRSRWSG